MAWSVACVLSSVLFPLPLPVLSPSTWTRKSKGKVKAQAFGGFNSAPWPGALAGHQYYVFCTYPAGQGWSPGEHAGDDDAQAVRHGNSTSPTPTPAQAPTHHPTADSGSRVDRAFWTKDASDSPLHAARCSAEKKIEDRIWKSLAAALH